MSNNGGKREETLKRRLLEHVPDDGKAISNRLLKDAVRKSMADLADDEFAHARDALVAEGKLLKGKGRGGSVRLAEPERDAQSRSQAPAQRAQDADAGPNVEDPASAYRHSTDAVLRPEVGVEAQFQMSKGPASYCYDSSLAPELMHDENAERDLAEWLIGQIAEAAEKGQAIFPEPKIHKGGGRSIFFPKRMCSAVAEPHCAIPQLVR